MDFQHEQIRLNGEFAARTEGRNRETCSNGRPLPLFFSPSLLYASLPREYNFNNYILNYHASETNWSSWYPSAKQLNTLCDAIARKR